MSASSPATSVDCREKPVNHAYDADRLLGEVGPLEVLNGAGRQASRGNDW
jgi:hypothetical protein